MVGNIPNFTKIDILRCFLRFGRNISRQELSRDLELGEGTIRTILEILKSRNLLESTKKGHFLSKKGTEALNEISAALGMPAALNIDDLYKGLSKIGLVVRKAPSHSLKELYKLRDTAVKSGAEGAILFRFDGKLYAPESDYTPGMSELEKHFKLGNDDVLVVSFAARKKDAETGALAIAAELSGFLKKFINGF